MTSDEATSGFLSENDNLSVALAIVRELEPLKNQLNKKFWSELVAFIEEKLRESKHDYSAHWKAKLSPEDNPGKWAYFDILPDFDYLKGVKSRVFVRIEQIGTGNQAFRYGVMAASTLTDAENDLDSVKEAKRQLVAKGFRPDRRSPWWLGLKSLDPAAREDRFLLSMAGDHQTFIREFALNIWNLFVDIEATLKEVNRDLNR